MAACHQDAVIGISHATCLPAATLPVPLCHGHGLTKSPAPSSIQTLRPNLQNWLVPSLSPFFPAPPTPIRVPGGGTALHWPMAWTGHKSGAQLALPVHKW